jgi:hypothetical protein
MSEDRMSDVSTRSGLRESGSDETNIQEKAQDAAGQAQDKAREAAGKAQEGMREQVEQRARQAGEKVSGTAGDLRSVGEELRKQGKDGPAKLADRAAEQTEKVGSYLSDKDPNQMLHDVEDFGRKRPWAMLAGGLVVGVAAARFLKASSGNRYRERSGTGATPRSTTQLGRPSTSPPPPREAAAPGTAIPPAPPVAPEPTGSPVAGP